MISFDGLTFFQSGLSLEGVICITCGCCFAVPSAMTANARKRGKFEVMIACPNGHKMGWGETELDKTRQERDRLKQLMAQKDDEIRLANNRAEDARNETVVAQRRLTRVEKRVSRGLCTCCNRTFQNLAEHMATKHGDAASAANVVKLHKNRAS